MWPPHTGPVAVVQQSSESDKVDPSAPDFSESWGEAGIKRREVRSGIGLNALRPDSKKITMGEKPTPVFSGLSFPIWMKIYIRHPLTGAETVFLELTGSCKMVAR